MGLCDRLKKVIDNNHLKRKDIAMARLLSLLLLSVPLYAMEKQALKPDELIKGLMATPEEVLETVKSKRVHIKQALMEHPDVITMRNSLPIPGVTLEVAVRAFMSPSGKTVVSLDDIGTIYITDLETGQTNFINYHNSICSLTFDPSGERFVTGGASLLLADIWDAASGKNVRTLEHNDRVGIALLNEDVTRMLTITVEPIFHVWDLECGVETVSLKYEGLDSYQGLFNKAGDQIVLVTKDHGLVIFNGIDSIITPEQKHKDRIVALSYNQDETMIVTASLDGTAWVWDAQGECIAVLKGHQGVLVAARFDITGMFVVTASDDKTAKIWNLEGNCLKTLEHTDKLTDARFNDDGTMVITASLDNTARLWCTKSGKMVLPLEGHKKKIYEVGFIGKRAYTLSEDGTCVLWDVEPVLSAINGLTAEQLVLVCSIMKCMRNNGLFKYKTLEEKLNDVMPLVSTAQLFSMRGNPALQKIYNGLPKRIKALFEPFVRENIYLLAQIWQDFMVCCCGPSKRKYRVD